MVGEQLNMILRHIYGISRMR